MHSVASQKGEQNFKLLKIIRLMDDRDNESLMYYLLMI